MFARACVLALLVVCLPVLAENKTSDADAKVVAKADQIINAYFATDAVRVDGWLQPAQVITSLRGNHPGAAAVFVLNLFLTEGRHKLMGEVIGPDGKLFTTIPFADELVRNGSEVRAVWGVLRGRLPTGGITVRVLHGRDNEQVEKLGQFFLLTIP